MPNDFSSDSSYSFNSNVNLFIEIKQPKRDICADLYDY